jgi:hypothetical protein
MKLQEWKERETTQETSSGIRRPSERPNKKSDEYAEEQKEISRMKVYSQTLFECRRLTRGTSDGKTF